MCGIAGFIDHTGSLSSAFLEDAIELLQHRGPDDSGSVLFSSAGTTIGFANTRLSIIDLSEHGHQPFKSRCGNFTLTFNGIIFNYRELRKELISKGAKFYSDSDTEVLLEAYIQWPETFLKKINGIYAFAIYDKAKSKVLIARDKVGVKPLFYYFDGRTLIFSSELRVFLKTSFLKKEINKEALGYYLQQAYFPTSFSILSGVLKLGPGELLDFDIPQRKLEKKRYWHLKTSNCHSSTEAALELLEQKLMESVRSRMVTDVPYGILLSGGYDSSAVAAIAQKCSTSPIKTFTIGFKEADFNEAEYARQIAKHLKTEHHTLYFDDDIIQEIIPSVGKIFDEPMGDSGAIPLLLAAKLAKPHVKVLLSADGGDEIFGGYPAYFKSKAYSRLSKWFFVPSPLQKKRFGNVLAQKNPLDFYRALSQYFTVKEVESLLGAVPNLDQGPGSNQDLNDLLLFDFNNYLPEDLLMKADRCTMHFGLENRDPLLNVDLVEYLFSLPPELKFRSNIPKYLLKQVVHKYIPKHLLDRPKKGFSMPVGKWLSESLKDFTEKTVRNLAKRDLLDGEEVSKIFERFRRDPYSYRSRQIWVLLSLELWLQEWFD